MASRFWVGGTGTWDASDTSHWASTSGGSSGASVPGSSDTATFDSSSGSGTVTVSTSPSITSLTSSGSGITINAGSNTFTLSGTGTSWNYSAGTFTAGTSTITTTGAGTTFAGGGKTYATVNLNGSGTTTVSGTNTFGSLARNGTAAKTDTLVLSANQTVSGTLTLSSNSNVNRLAVLSNTTGTARTITAATVTITNTVLFQDITGAGAATWTVAGTGATYIGDCGGNSGITATTSAAQTWSGTSGGNWSANAWTSRVPLPQDDVNISSAFVSSQTVVNDMPHLGRTIEWTGTTGSPVWSFNSVAVQVFGGIKLIPGMTTTGSQNLTLSGRSSYTLTSAGVSYFCGVILDAPGGTYTLVDDFSASAVNTSNFTHTRGGWVANGFNVTFNKVDSSNTNTRTLNLGSGTWTLIGSDSGVKVWNLTTTTNLTFSGSSASIFMTNTSATVRTFNGGSLTYGNFYYVVAGSTGALTISGNNTFSNFNFSDASNARTLTLTSGSTQTITNSFIVSGSSGKLITINSTSGGSAATLSKASGTVASDYLSVQDSTATGGASWYAGSHSTSVSGNTGWSFTDAPVAPATGGTVALMGV